MNYSFMNHHMLSPAKRARLREANDLHLCPECSTPIVEGQGLGSGRIADGLFCTLDCYGKFYAEVLVEKHTPRLRARNN